MSNQFSAELGNGHTVAVVWRRRWTNGEYGGEQIEPLIESIEIDARPLVVIDPDDREQVERLVQAYKPGTVGVVNMQAALRSLLAPPKPEEPTGVGAVVRDDRGALWIKIDEHTDCNDWAKIGAPSHEDEEIGKTVRWKYAEISAVRVLSEGVTP